jgi:mRNA-degrading endonuclease YafQ of YafQ-DinJ toxin-antitoxin module
MAKNRQEQPREWGFTYSHLFQSSLIDGTRVFADLPTKVERFVSLKKDNPLSSLYGKHDRPCTGELVGFWHCHLRDDAVLIYKLMNRCVHLICIIKHADMEGRRLKNTSARIRLAVPESIIEQMCAEILNEMRYL